MKINHLVIPATAITAAIWWHSHTPEPTTLSFRLGQTFEQVVRDSTYPALQHANRPADDPGGDKFGAIWVTEPAVFIRFTDPKHGFTLPPTKFAALTFAESQAITLATSPMLDPLPFDEAVAILENLQNQFKAGSWEPWEKDDSTVRLDAGGQAATACTHVRTGLRTGGNSPYPQDVWHDLPA
jgi:hypothetical protein